MSIHRQRSRKDLGDAAGAFGHRLFEAKKRRALLALALAMRRLLRFPAQESKQRQERKQTRALQASGPSLGLLPVLASLTGGPERG